MSSQMKTSAIAACLLATIGAVSAASAATITNGSFELGNAPGSFAQLAAGSTAITGWTIGGGGVDYIGTYWQASNGNRSIDLNATSPGTISQTITDLVIGQQYQISFDLAGNPDGDNGIAKTLNAITASAGTQAFSFTVGSNTHASMGWTTFYFLFTALSTTEMLTFASTTTTGGPSGAGAAVGPALDNVRIAETPLPAALPLFATVLAGGGLIAWRRKRKAAKPATA